MTDTAAADRPETQTLPRRRIYMTDAELIRELGLPEKVAYEAFRALDQNPRSGFPAKQQLWGGRRYLPAVLAYFDKANGLTVGTSANQRGSNV